MCFNDVEAIFEYFGLNSHGRHNITYKEINLTAVIWKQIEETIASRPRRAFLNIS